MPSGGCSPLVPPFVSPFGPSRLIASYAPRVSSAHPLTFLIGSSARSLPRIARLPVSSTSGTGRGCDRRRAACLPASGRWTERFGHLSSPSHPLIQSARLVGSFNHPIDGGGGGSFFSFSPDPLPPALLGLLAGACSPVPGRGMRGLRPWLAVAGGGADCLRSSSPVPLSRCRSFARCYMPCVASCRCSYPGSCVAFYGLFRPLICRRWRF